MKRFLFYIIIFLMIIFIFSCCENPENTPAAASDYLVIDYNDYFKYENGELYVDAAQRLHFVDFSSVTDALICPKPNCPHSDETCSAFGMDNHPVICGGSLYFFEDNTRFEDENPISSLNIYRADSDGTGRMKIDTLDGITLHSGTSSVFGNGVLYFAGTDENPENKPFGVRELYLCGYDFEQKNLAVKELLCEGYSNNLTFCGERDGELFIILSYQSEKADWWDGDGEEVRAHNGAELRRVSVTEYKKLDLKTSEIIDWELPEKIVSAHEKRTEELNSPIYGQIKEGQMILSDGVDTLISDPSGREIFIKDFNGNDKAVANGYIFDDLSTGICTARRLSDGKEISVNIANENLKAGYVSAYLDGKYIVRFFDFDRQKALYCAISEEEMIRG